jgi:hypothetical protein
MMVKLFYIRSWQALDASGGKQKRNCEVGEAYVQQWTVVD